MDIQPVLVEVHDSGGHVGSSSRRHAPGTIQASHCYVRVFVNLFQLHELKAFHSVDGELGLLGGVYGRETVLEPSFLASDLTS